MSDLLCFYITDFEYYIILHKLLLWGYLPCAWEWRVNWLTGWDDAAMTHVFVFNIEQQCMIILENLFGMGF